MSPASRSRAPLVLVVDDQESGRTFLGRFLEESGYRVALAESVDAALAIAGREPLSLAITDLRMPGADGIEGLRRLRELDPDLPVIVLTAYGTVETAVRAMKLGAFDYLKKPFEPEEMEIVVVRALAHRSLVEENRKLRAEVAERYRIENLVGRSAAMARLADLVRKVAPVDVPVLITGESGTGKDLVARAVHGLSSRARKTFLSVNCAAVSESLLESELFGHVRGAFTGAERARAGYFREADGGTLFLDEIAELAPAHQAKLLRALESGEVVPVGSEQPVEVDVRVVAATNRDLDRMVSEGKFREDLLFRIETVRVALPALRERREDVPLLAAHFLQRAPTRAGVRAPGLSVEALRVLVRYDWPGNVRELCHAIEYAVLLCEGDEIGPEHLPAKIGGGVPRAGRVGPGGSYREAKRAFDVEYFTDLLRRADGNVTAASDIAGLHRATLYETLHRLGIDHEAKPRADGEEPRGGETGNGADGGNGGNGGNGRTRR